MKRLVLLFFLFNTIFVANCSNKEEKSSLDIPESQLVEAYVQISLIYESERGLAEKDARVELYLDENNLSKQKIDRMLDKYKSNPNEWRGFFMKVQTRLRELEARQRDLIAEKESITIVESEDLITIKSNFPAIVDTVITRSTEIESEQFSFDELISKNDSSRLIPEQIASSIVQADTQFIKPEKNVLDDAIVELQNIVEAEDDKTDEIVNQFQSSDESKEIGIEEGLGFIYYKVESGDNLSTLAKEYDSKTTQLLMVNSLENANSIRIGQTLLIPNKFTEVLLHTISSGDVLSKISSRYNSDLDLLIEINKIDNVHSIKADDFLYVPILKGE